MARITTGIINDQEPRIHGAIGEINLDCCSTQKAIRRFQSIYASVDDIDLFVGGVSEFPVEDAVLGPTFLCIIGDQFTRAKRGDRFFYEFEGPQGFTPGNTQ
jgi:hypothetical protein